LEEITGLYHASSGESWTDFDFANTINDVFELGKIVKPGNLDEYLQTATRPYQKNTALNCNRLKNMLDIELKTVLQALKEVKSVYDSQN
jgi:dTDP-4-dehydrorhamnose reductase